MRAVLLVVLAVAAGAAVGVAAMSRGGSAETSAPRARNVVVLVGDGMGSAQRRLIASRARRALAMDALPVRGVLATASTSGVTDSAAAGTALFTGVRTENGAVGVGPGGEQHAALVDDARATGRATGLVTTSRLTDATPAAFGGANVRHRDEQGEIGRQLLEESRVDVLLGGGADVLGARASRARRLGYRLATSVEELRVARGPRLLGLLAERELYARDPGERPTLAALTATALRVLARDDDGFLLLVEEEEIDHAGHEGDAEALARAGVQLDAAVSAVLRFADGHPDTLVVVLGDHETGGLALDRAPDGSLVPRFTTGDHTAADVPLTARGPGAAALRGRLELTGVHDALRRALLRRTAG